MTQDTLRRVRLDSPSGRYLLETWEAVNGGLDSGRYRIGYRLADPNGRVIFEGEEFRPSPCHAIDSDESLRSLLGFLTLKPGDTDREYFASYTAEQIAFATSFDCECLGLYALEFREDEELEFGEAEDMG